MAQASGGGSEGKGSGSAPAGPSQAIDSGPTRTGPVDVLDAGGITVAQFGRDGTRTPPRAAYQDLQAAKRNRDFPRELTEEIAKASAEKQPKPEAETVRGIERRADLYADAYLEAKRPALDALPKDLDAPLRIARRLEELRTRDVEPLPPKTAQQWAELDALEYRMLKTRRGREDAAVAMADVARGNAAYRATLAVQAPAVSERVQALDAAVTVRSEAKDTRKGAALVAKDIDATPEARTAAIEAATTRGEAANDALRGSTSTSIDAATLDRLAAVRARDSKQAADELGLNVVEPAAGRAQKLARDPARPAAAQSEPVRTAPQSAPAENRIASDEAFAAAQVQVKPRVPPEIEAKYLRVGDKFFHPKNTDVVAFEDKGNKLETRSNSEQVAETLVTIARSRGWEDIKVSGTETFRKEVWLEAASHGMHVTGYNPSEVDKAELVKRMRTVDVNKAEADQPAARDVDPEARARAQAFAGQPAAEAVKDHPELAGSVAAAAAIHRRTVADNLTPQQQAVVAARVRQNITNSIERGEIPEIKVRERTEVQQEVRQDRDYSR